MNEKQNIGSLFDRIAGTYDKLNHLLSLNIDKRWRRKAVGRLQPCGQLLDVAIGTADLAIEIMRQQKAEHVTGIDLSAELHIPADALPAYAAFTKAQMDSLSEAELPARKEEVEHAKEEGIVFKLLNNPVEILGDEKGFVNSIKAIRMELGEPDESGRRSPVPIAGSEHEIDCDAMIIALAFLFTAISVIGVFLGDVISHSIFNYIRCIVREIISVCCYTACN